MIGKFMCMVLIFPLTLPAAAQEAMRAPGAAQASGNSRDIYPPVWTFPVCHLRVTSDGGTPMLFASIAMTGGGPVDSLKPISGLGIVVKKNPGGAAERTTSGSDGGYAFEGLAPGSYTLTAAGRQPLQVMVGRDGKLAGTITQGGGTVTADSVSFPFTKIEYGMKPSKDERVSGDPHVYEKDTRWDLTFDIGPVGPDGITPVVMEHAINTKGTGTDKGRQAAPTPVACDSAGAGGRDRGTPSVSEISMASVGSKASCTVRAVNDMPAFDIKVPLGDLMAQRKAAAGKHFATVVIVMRGARPDLPMLAPCDSATAGKPSEASWDLKLATKG